jgi:2-methylisocitrate lyase-like PEP mutase family enzyme
VTDRLEKTRRFLDLHRPGTPLLLPNPWDVGTAKQFAAVGFQALATTSNGYAGTLGRADGELSRDEALAHAGAIADASDLPVTADLENCFADTPEGVAETVRRAAEVGIAGCSLEDYTGDKANVIYDAALAADRVKAAVEVARGEATRLVLTARAENYLHGLRDLADTIARLQAFQSAGADVVYAPGLSDLGEIEQVVRSVDVPVNVLLVPGGPTVPELASVGVARISVGGAFHLVSVAAVESAARELLEKGTHGYWEQAMQGLKIKHRASD